MRAGRQVHLQNAETNFGDPLTFGVDAARAFGQVAADLRSHGRTRGARAFDALIAAIARSEDLPVYTFNPVDFDGVRQLDVVSLPPDAHA